MVEEPKGVPSSEQQSSDKSTKEWNMDPKELEQLLAKAAAEAAEKTAAAIAKKAAEEAGKQAEIQNRTLEESLNWYESALFSDRKYFRGQTEYDDKQYGLRAAKANNEELGKSQKLQEAYTGEFEKYLNIALTNEAELTKIEAAGTKGKKAKTDANANYLKQLEKNRAAAKGEYDDALRQANLDRDNALKLDKNREEKLNLLLSSQKQFELGELYDKYNRDNLYLCRIPWEALCEKVGDKLREKFKDKTAPEYFTITIGDRNYIVHCDEQSRYSRFYKKFSLKNEDIHVDL
jgi:hypothetical protein